MATESHELRLKIDSSAAEAGSRKFTAAVASVRKAVEGLERDSTGAFTNLKNISPKVDVSGLKAASAEANRLSKATTGTANASDRAAERIRKLAIQSANSLRVSTDQASRLRERLLSVGDTAGLAKLEAGLARLRISLTNATSGLDVREARAGYADLASELNRTARASERLRAEASAAARAEEEAAAAARNHATALDNLRARYDSTFRVSKQYEAALRDINTLEQAGALSAAKAAQARHEASQSLMAASAATDSVTRANIGMGRQLGLQINQMGQVAGMATSMEQALKGVSYQAADIGLVFGTTGIAIGAVAGVVLPLLIDRLYDVIPPTKTFKDALEDLNESIDKVRSTASRTDDLAALRSEYGLLSQEVMRLIEVQSQLAQIDAASDLRAARDALFSDTAGVSWMESLAGYAANAEGRTRRLRDELDLTKKEAASLEALFTQSRATNNAEKLADLYAQMRQEIVAAAGGVENLNDAQAETVRKLTEAEDAARRTTGAIGAAVSQTNAWAGAMSGVRAEINAILSSLASIGGGVISNAAKSAELTALNAGKSVKEAAVARVRFEKEQEFAAKEMSANSTGGIAGWAQGQLLEMEKYQFERGLALDSQLDAARASARKAASASATTGGTGRSSRKAALTEEQKAVEKLTKSLDRRLQSLQEENLALELVASGQFATEEGARAMAEAMTSGTGVVDQQTAAMVRQIDAASALNEQLKTLAEDPVKKWMDSVPNWIEAGQQIEMGAINSLKDSISEMIKTGKFDIEALGDSILGVIADIVADKAVAELANLLGRGEGNGLGSLLGGLFNSQGDDPNAGQGAAVANGGMQAGQHISTAMMQAGQTVSQQLSQAMTQGGMQAGQGVQQAHAVGGQQAANATRLAGVQHGQQVRMATTTSGGQHATRVRTAIEAGGQQHASMISAASGGGAGGGILDSLGGFGGIASMVLGSFDVGGVSTAPANFTTAPVSAFRNAPHFSEGTANTSGIPAMLHDNEAVIPLTKGRKVPVEMNGAAGANGGPIISYNPTYQINTPDADSFRKSQKQVTSEGYSAAARAARSNT